MRVKLPREPIASSATLSSLIYGALAQADGVSAHLRRPHERRHQPSPGEEIARARAQCLMKRFSVTNNRAVYRNVSPGLSAALFYLYRDTLAMLASKLPLLAALVRGLSSRV